ncbi:MAG: zinc-binding dehydrogenase [Desulfobacterales bacterium]|nr:MAG: zinc-binding dehydrogenase [Desulfobacterales bacterium]
MRTIYFEKRIPKMLLTKALQPIWPAVVYSRLSPTRFVDVPEKPLPGPRWVRMRNRLCGICASHLHLLFVDADPRVSPAALPGTERIYLGHEVLSEVTEVGAGVTTLKKGDRVILDSPEANCLSQEIEPICRPCREGHRMLCENASLGQNLEGMGGGWGDGFTAHETGVYQVPHGLDDETAMMIEPLAVGVRTALRCLPDPQQRVLVVGSGMIGLAVIAALRVLSPDCRIAAMARYPQQVAMARKLGADEIIVREDPYRASARITAGKLYTGQFKNRMILGGFDVVYDCVGSERTVSDSLRWARAGGTVVLAGVNLKPMHVDLTPIWYQEVDLIGVYAHGTEEWNGRRQSTYDLTADLLLKKKLFIEGLITHRFPLAQWRTAVRTAKDKRSGAIKVVLDLRLET